MAAVEVIRKPLPEDLRKREILPLIVRILHCGGMLVDPSEKINIKKLIAYTLGKCFIVSCLIIASVGFLVEAWRESGNLHDFSECLKYILKQSRNVIKVVTVLIHKKKILNFMKNLQESFFIHDKDLSVEERAITQKCMENARRFSFLYWLQWVVVLALESSIKGEIHEVKNHNITTENLGEMPLKLWVPFPTHKAPLYQIGFVYNTLFVIVGSWYSAVTDTLIFSFLFYITSQFQILGNSIKNMAKHVGIEMHIHQTGKSETKVFEEEYRLNDDENNEFRFEELATEDANGGSFNMGLKRHAVADIETWNRDHTYNREIKNHLARCIAYHQQLFENVEVLTSIMSPIEALELLSASILIAVTGFSMIFSYGSGNFFKNTAFLLYIILGLGLHCWLADRLTTQSLQVYHDAYSSLWYDQETGVKKSIGMVIMRAQTPVILKAGPLFPLSLETFGKILQTSYSYLTLLTQVYEK